MSHSTLFIISRFSPSSLVNNHTIATTSFSFKLARKALKSPPDPGRYSRYVSMSHSHLSPGIPHPSTHTIKPKANPQTFEDTSKPRPVHRRVQYRTRELPEIKTRWPIFVALGVGALSIWGVFLLYTTNQERLSSSVIRQFILKLKRTQNPEVLESLGTNVTLQPVWWMFNEPYINGQINMPKGNIDVSMRVHGSKGAGTLYFTSVRREKAAPFTILRFKVITDDGKTIILDPTEEPDNVKPPV